MSDQQQHHHQHHHHHGSAAAHEHGIIVSAFDLAAQEKTSSAEKYEQLALALSGKKTDLQRVEQQLVAAKQQPGFDPKNKPAEFVEMERQVKSLKEQVNQMTKEWRRADPDKLHIDRQEFEEHLVRRFFVVPSFEIYGGVSGLFDFGPVACSVKSNVINLWRQHFVLEEQMMELECTILTPEPVFVASGHVQRFTDFLVRDVETGDGYRADKLLAEFIESKLDDPNVKDQSLIDLYQQTLKEVEGYSQSDLAAKFKQLQVKAPGTGNDLTDPQPFNLMFGTQIGPTGKLQGYLRPETAQGLFVNFKRCLDYSGGQMPIAVANVGQAFRNEIAPRSGLLRVREFTLAEIEHFVNPKHTEHPKFSEVENLQLRLLSNKLQSSGKAAQYMVLRDAMQNGTLRNQTLAYFIARTYMFMRKCGILESGIRFRQHMPNEMAHYASDCWDCELLTSYGWVECVGLADRSCFDLTQHSKATKQDMFAYEAYAEPKLVDEVLVVPNKAKFNPQLRTKAKPTLEYLEELTDEEKLALQEKLDKDGKITVTVPIREKLTEEEKLEGNHDPRGKIVAHETVELDKELISFKKQQKKISGENFIPAVIEPAFGIGRIIYAILEHSFWVRKEEEAAAEATAAAAADKKKGKADPSDKKISRVVFSFTPTVAPYKVALLPLQQNAAFLPFVEKLKKQLNRASISNRDDTTGTSIGKRYARMDDIGVPFAITIDFDSLNNNTVTLRERDSCTQIRANVDEIVQTIGDLIDGRMTWEEARERYPEQKQTASEKVGKK